MTTPSILFVFNTVQEHIQSATLILEAKKRMLPVYTCFNGGKSLRATLKKNDISFLVVHGHTKTGTAAAKMAFRSGIDVVHIADDLPTESEKESHQRVVNHLSKWHFVANKKCSSTAPILEKKS